MVTIVGDAPAAGRARIHIGAQSYAVVALEGVLVHVHQGVGGVAFEGGVLRRPEHGLSRPGWVRARGCAQPGDDRVLVGHGAAHNPDPAGFGPVVGRGAPDLDCVGGAWFPLRRRDLDARQAVAVRLAARREQLDGLEFHGLEQERTAGHGQRITRLIGVADQHVRGLRHHAGNRPGHDPVDRRDAVVPGAVRIEAQVRVGPCGLVGDQRPPGAVVRRVRRGFHLVARHVASDAAGSVPGQIDPGSPHHRRAQIAGLPEDGGVEVVEGLHVDAAGTDQPVAADSRGGGRGVGQLDGALAGWHRRGEGQRQHLAGDDRAVVAAQRHPRLGAPGRPGHGEGAVGHGRRAQVLVELDNQARPRHPGPERVDGMLVGVELAVLGVHHPHDAAGRPDATGVVVARRGQAVEVLRRVPAPVGQPVGEDPVVLVVRHPQRDAVRPHALGPLREVIHPRGDRAVRNVPVGDLSLVREVVGEDPFSGPVTALAVGDHIGVEHPHRRAVREDVLRRCVPQPRCPQAEGIPRPVLARVAAPVRQFVGHDLVVPGPVAGAGLRDPHGLPVRPDAPRIVVLRGEGELDVRQRIPVTTHPGREPVEVEPGVGRVRHPHAVGLVVEPDAAGIAVVRGEVELEPRGARAAAVAGPEADFQIGEAGHHLAVRTEQPEGTRVADPHVGGRVGDLLLQDQRHRPGFAMDDRSHAQRDRRRAPAGGRRRDREGVGGQAGQRQQRPGEDDLQRPSRDLRPAGKDGRVGDGRIAVAQTRDRPGRVAVRVRGPHLDLVPDARRDPADRSGQAGLVPGTGRPGAGHALAVLQVVALDRRTARVLRRRPADREAGRRARDRRDRGRARRPRRLQHVVEVDRHRGRGRGDPVRGRDRHRVARLRLVVVADARLRLDLATARIDRERGLVGPAQLVGEVFAVGVVGVGGLDRRAHVPTRRRVLRQPARHRRLAEHGRRVRLAAHGDG